MIFVANMVNSYMLIDIMMTRNIHECKLGVKHGITMKNPWSRISQDTKWKNSLISGPSWPIFMIFVAIMVNSYVLIDIMMTRNVHEWILGVKPWIIHENPLGENFAVILYGENSHISGPSLPILMIFVANIVNSSLVISFMMIRSSSWVENLATNQKVYFAKLKFKKFAIPHISTSFSCQVGCLP